MIEVFGKILRVMLWTIAIVFLVLAFIGCASLNKLAESWPQPDEVHVDDQGRIINRVYKKP